MQWFAQAPSNIALIKYMGKQENSTNIPMNASLSYTLNKLQSSVMLEKKTGKQDFWEPLNIPGAMPFSLSERGQKRFLQHLERLKRYFNYEGAFIVRSSNNFPHGNGLASSASSFAALTKCAAIALSELTHQDLPSVATQAQLSREGSGSSCRSFFAPWALWQGEVVHPIELPYKELLHQVIIISHEEKAVASSDAHQRIHTSTLFTSRAERAENNLKTLLDNLQHQDWQSAYHVCWREFQDMHQLFATSNPPFGYFNDQVHQVLNQLQTLWEQEGDGPIVTMDAGPNIHLLYRLDQTEQANRFKKDHLIGNYDVL